MAKKSKHNAKRKVTVPLAVIGGLIPVGAGLWSRRSNATEMGNFIVSGFTGYNPTTNSFSITSMRGGLFPVIAGIAAHRFAGMLGINRAIAKTGIPFIRI